MQKLNLEKNKIKSNFQIPENYFEEFEKRMLHEIENISVEKPQINVFRQYRYAISGMAAVLILTLTLVFNTNSKTNMPLESNQIEDYLLSQSTTENMIFWDEIALQDDNVQMEIKLNIDKNELENYIQKNIDLEYHLD
jgi:hypothetical protein